MNSLVCHGISVAFDGVQVLSDISFTLDPGSIVGLIGPNGSGKTTLLNVISGRTKPLRGSATYGTEPLTGRPSHALAALGLFRSFQEGRLFERLTGLENIAAVFRPPLDERLSAALALSPLRDAHAIKRDAAVSAALASAGLEADRHRLAGEMSYGIRKRTIMGQALAFDSAVCLLDEPLAGLDPGTRGRMLEVVAALRNPGRIVLLVEHDLEAVQALADRVLLMDRGQIVADGTPYEVCASDIFLKSYLQGYEH
jgi:ABC-type branched-subunit amino acid transport system ATPase component